MPFATRGNLVWLGMILSGVALGFYVVAAWPDTSPRVTRLPYGEVMPKTPRAAPAAEKVAAQEMEVVAAPAPATPDAEPTAVEAAPAPDRAPASAPSSEDAAAPAESPYELGAAPLPGDEATPAPAATKNARSGPATTEAAPEPAPEPAPEEPPLVELIIGSAPPSGPE